MPTSDTWWISYFNVQFRVDFLAYMKIVKTDTLFFTVYYLAKTPRARIALPKSGWNPFCSYLLARNYAGEYMIIVSAPLIASKRRKLTVEDVERPRTELYFPGARSGSALPQPDSNWNGALSILALSRAYSECSQFANRSRKWSRCWRYLVTTEIQFSRSRELRQGTRFGIRSYYGDARDVAGLKAVAEIPDNIG